MVQQQNLLLWTLLLIACALIISGFIIWYKRRKRRPESMEINDSYNKSDYVLFLNPLRSKSMTKPKQNKYKNEAQKKSTFWLLKAAGNNKYPAQEFGE